MARPGLIRIAGALLFVLFAAAAAQADDRGTSIDATLRAFVDAWPSHDLRAFDPLAADPPARGVEWRWVRSALADSDCIDVRGARWTIEENDGRRARAVVDIDGTIGGKPLITPWTLGLVHDERGWHIAMTAITAREMATSFLSGEHEWWQTCLGEETVPPSVLGYYFGDVTSRQIEHWTPREEEAMEKATNLARDMHDRLTLAFIDAFRARAAFNNRRFDQAVKWGEAGVADATAIGAEDPLEASRLFLGLGEWKQGHIAVAQAELEEVADSIERITNRRIALAGMLNVCFLRFFAHDYRGALVAAKRALAASRQYHWTETEVTALGYMAAIHEELHDYRPALDYRRQQRAAAMNVGGNEAYDGVALAGMASDELALGETAAAARHVEEALRMPTDMFRTLQVQMWYGIVLMHDGKLAEAERAFREAIAAGRKTGEGQLTALTLARLSGLCAREHRAKEALAIAQEAAAQAKLVGGVELAEGLGAAMHLAMGRALAAAGRYRDAIPELRAAIEETEKKRTELPDIATIRFYFDNSEPYHELVTLLLRVGRPLDALQVAERMRSRALIESLQRNGQLTVRLSPDEERRQRELEQKVAKLNRELVASGETSAVRQQLEEAHENLDRFTNEMAVLHGDTGMRRIETETMQRSLPAALRDTVVLEYVVSDTETIVFAVRRKGHSLDVRARVLPLPRAKLAKRIERFMKAIEQRDADYAEPAAALYRALLAPVESSLAGASMIAIVPDMELWTLPFHALRGPSGRHLLEDADLFYASSLTALQIAMRHTRRHDHPPVLLAFGNPTPGSAAIAELRDANRGALLGALPDAEREVRTIAALYGPGRSRVYVGQAARESVFKQQASHYDVLHFATHGLLDDDAPMYSALLLAPSRDVRGDDGLLETREIVRMHLKADLAVLAACNTAGGAVQPGEGVIGVSWAFLMAGCPTTIVSQWAASSAATSELMIDFHTALTRGRSKSDALRAAQLSMLHGTRYQHPYYWASFVVLGMPF